MKLNERILRIEKAVSELQNEAADQHEWQTLKHLQEALGALYDARSDTVDEQIELLKTIFD